MNELSAPEIDGLLRMLEQKNFNPESYDEELKQKISVLYGMLDKIESTKEDDDLKILYFSAKKGNIEDYGDYEELKEYGDVSSYEEGWIECPEMPHKEIIRVMKLMDKAREIWGLKFPCE